MKNNNQKISVLLAKREYQADKGRSRILTGVVALVVLTLFSVFSLVVGKVDTYMIRDARQRGTVVSTTLERATQEQYEQIHQLTYIKYVGKHVCFGSALGTKCAVIDEVAWEKIKSPAFTDIHGDYPQEKTDVMLPMSALRHLGITEPEVGMEIRLDIELADDREETYDFRLSGYYTEYIATIQYGPPDSYFSDAFLDSISNGSEWDTTLLLRQDDRLAGDQVESMLYEDITMRDNSQQFIGGSTMTWEAFRYLSGGFDKALMMVIIILVCTGLVIYNVLYISFGRSIRKFGLLKTLGTTEKQLRHIAFLQVAKVIRLGSLIGVLLGIFVAQMIIPALLSKMYLPRFGSASGMVTFHPLLLAGSVLFGAAITCLSSVFAIWRVVRLTPIESMNYMEKISGRTRRKKLSRKNRNPRFELARMAWRNILRFKKRFILAILSLTLGLIVSLGMIMVSKGSDTTNEIEYKYPDFHISTTVDANVAEMINPYDLFPEALLKQIENLSGIQEIIYSRGGYGEIMVDEKALKLRIGDINTDMYFYRSPFVVQKVDDEYLAALKELAGEENLHLDVDRVIQGEGVILLHEHSLSPAQIEQSKDSIGMPIGIYSFDDGKKTRDMDFCGYLDLENLKKYETDGLPVLRHTWIGDGIIYFITSEKGFQNMGIKEQIFSLDITAEPESEPILYKDLSDIIADYNSQFVTDDGQDTESEGTLYNELDSYSYRVLESLFKRDILNEERDQINSNRVVMGFICAILLFMGLMNYVNVTATGLVIRKREFAVMESIGMTAKQLKKMLLLEGMFYGIIISVLTAVFGAGILWVAGMSIKKGMEYFVFSYPVVEFGVCVLILFVSCILVVLLMYHRYGRDSIYSRMRMYTD